MSAVRLLIAGVACVAAVGTAVAEPPPPKVAVPKWVYASGAIGHVGNIGKAGAEIVDRGFRCESLEDAERFTDVILATRAVLKHRPKLFTGKPTTMLKGYAGATAVDVALTGGELLTGRIDTTQAVESVLIGTVARAGGMAVGAGVVWAVGTWGVASTGTAISTLSGAAYTSAVMAKLGGGAVAAEGGGMAVGSAVLTGGVVVAAVAVGYGAKKLYDLANPAQRDGYTIYYNGVAGHDFVDGETAAGAAILAEQRAIAELRQRLVRQRR